MILKYNTQKVLNIFFSAQSYFNHIQVNKKLIKKNTVYHLMSNDVHRKVSNRQISKKLP